MAEAVGGGAAEDRPLLVEAGTGTGKTLAYLVPAILSGRKVVVSTATRALQEQIYFKDLPTRARGARGRSASRFRAALMKGLSNYVCKRRPERGARVGRCGRGARGGSSTWAEETGRRRPQRARRHAPRTSPRGRRCSRRPRRESVQSATYYDECFVTRMKRDAEERRSRRREPPPLLRRSRAAADRRERASAIPAYDAVIFDEAHQLEDVATTFFGSSDLHGAHRLAGPRRAAHARPQGENVARSRCPSAQDAGRAFFWRARSRAARRAGASLRARARGRGRAARRLASTRLVERALKARWLEAGARRDPAHRAARAGAPRSRSRGARRSIADGVRKPERRRARDRVGRVARRSVASWATAPSFSASILGETLFSRGTVRRLHERDADDARRRGRTLFEFLRERLGAPDDGEDARRPFALRLSPIAPASTSPRDLPEPQRRALRRGRRGARDASSSTLTGGGAFVLCTSSRSMRAMYARLKTARAERARGARSWSRASGPKSLLLSQFRAARPRRARRDDELLGGRRRARARAPPRRPRQDPVRGAERSRRRRALRGHRARRESCLLQVLRARRGDLAEAGLRTPAPQRDGLGLVALLDRRALTKAYGRALLAKPAARARPLRRWTRCGSSGRRFSPSTDRDSTAPP